MSRLLLCVNDAYDPDTAVYDTLDAFLTMCGACHGERPVLVEHGDGSYTDGDGATVLVPFTIGAGPHSIDTPEGAFIDGARVTIGQTHFIPCPEDAGGAVIFRRSPCDERPCPDDEVFVAVGSVLAITENPDDYLGRISPGALRAIMDWWDGHPNDLVRGGFRPLARLHTPEEA